MPARLLVNAALYVRTCTVASLPHGPALRMIMGKTITYIGACLIH